MIVGLALLFAALVLRGATATNKYIGGRLLASATVFALYVLAAIVLDTGRLAADVQVQIREFQPALLAFGVINLLATIAINPWRENRLPDRFPNIVQDAITVVLFAIVVTVILRDRMLATTAAGAVVLGLALQDTLGNLISGLAIQIEKPFRVGHWVNLGGSDGLVSEITWRATKIRTKAGNFIVVPNSVLAKDRIINYSEPTPHTRIEIEVGASYDAPPNDVRATIFEAIRHDPLIARDREPEVLVHDFAASSITYLIRVWITDFSADQRVADRVRTAIYYAFRRRGISIPYPIQVQYERPWPEMPAERAALDVALRRVPIFDALTDAQQAHLVEAARPALYGAGEVIVREGDAGSSMFVIARGEAVVTMEAATAPLARLKMGDFFGEMSLLTGDPRTATVSASTDCELVEITAEGFRGFVMSEPVIADRICAAVEKRRAELQQHRAAHAEQPPQSEPPRSLISRMRQFLRLSS